MNKLLAAILDPEAAAARGLQAQLSEVRSKVKLRVEARVKRVKNAYHLRGAKLTHAASLTREAPAV
jgi:LPS O-antigen subunit length determinant protein (WzzB/FepE family)